MNWISYFKKDVQNKLRAADNEYRKYREGGQTIYLQQACEKLFSVVENMIMVKYGRKKRGFHAILNMAMQNDDDRSLLNEAVQLHYFYYNGQMEMLDSIAEGVYLKVRERVRRRLNK